MVYCLSQNKNIKIHSYPQIVNNYTQHVRYIIQYNTRVYERRCEFDSKSYFYDKNMILIDSSMWVDKDICSKVIIVITVIYCAGRLQI